MRELRFRTRRGVKFRDHDDDDEGIPGGDDLDPLLRLDDNNHVSFSHAVVARNNNNNIDNNVQQQQAIAPARLPRQRREHHAHHPVRAVAPFRERLETFVARRSVPLRPHSRRLALFVRPFGGQRP